MHQQRQPAHLVHMLAMHFDIVNADGNGEERDGADVGGADGGSKCFTFSSIHLAEPRPRGQRTRWDG